MLSFRENGELQTSFEPRAFLSHRGRAESSIMYVLACLPFARIGGTIELVMHFGREE